MTSYEAKKQNIKTWIGEYIEKAFTMRYPDNFGHLFVRHMNLKEDHMMNRCRKESINVSSFLGSSERIVEMIRNTLLAHQEEVAEYLADDVDQEPWIIYGELPEDIQGVAYLHGRSHDWSKGAISCTEFVVVIRKLQRENGFCVQTAHPIPPN